MEITKCAAQADAALGLTLCVDSDLRWSDLNELAELDRASPPAANDALEALWQELDGCAEQSGYLDQEQLRKQLCSSSRPIPRLFEEYGDE